MSLPRFSQVLVKRRRELGLTTAQAARYVGIREDVLIAFEEGDFERLPQEGYAVGMLANYANYLGLDSREVTELFREDLDDYTHGGKSQRNRRNNNQSGRSSSSSSSRNSSSSRTGSIEYPTTGEVRTRGSSSSSSSYGTSYNNSYGSYGYSPYQSTYQQTSYSDSSQTMDIRSGTSGRRGHQYNASDDDYDDSRTSSSDAARRRSNSQRRRSDSSYNYGYANSNSSSSRSYRRDDVSTREVREGEFTDDMRYDNSTSPYAPASSASGRQSSKNIASTERPNVKRRSSQSSGSGKGSKGRNSGSSGTWLFIFIIVLTVILTAILTISVTSCVNDDDDEEEDTSITVTTVDTEEDESDEESTSDESTETEDTTAEESTDESSDESTTEESTEESTEEESTETDETSTEDTTTTTASSEPTEVVVTIEDGGYSWIEITCDGVSEVAESLTGPWTGTYTVEDSFSLIVGKPSVVSVTVNGEEVEFSTTTAGVGSLNIEGSGSSSDDESSDETDESEETDETDESTE